MQELDYPPPTTSHLRRTYVIIMAVVVLIVAVGLFNIYSSLAPRHSSRAQPLHSRERQQLISQLAAAQSPAQPEDGWVESRDGDGALDVEDVNGTATIISTSRVGPAYSALKTAVVTVCPATMKAVNKDAPFIL